MLGRRWMRILRLSKYHSQPFDWKFYTPKKLTLQLIAANVCISRNKFSFFNNGLPAAKKNYSCIDSQLVLRGLVSRCNLGDPAITPSSPLIRFEIHSLAQQPLRAD